ncbi:hypothetical protein L202_03623 [Cryptococcus amylolentus CBS 6039]|uniref:Uncharacterized protein n=1 Tax=Cryptococcus amylolentus CBS 6039 TaxID=1295533 RepID=A0A1E3HU78_9TREE|nr:hypothetical protein L202_03623 [Cryptococcus amylolentus CBS 6039]ODN79695.1 hypothetical protein L202_03623 [Cryptococcus amylolentus CBS 6039]
MIIPFYKPTPAPPGIFKNQPLPYSNASFAGKFFLQWIAPMIKAAWSRPIQQDDIWDITPDLSSKTLGDELERHYMRRVPPSKRPAGYYDPSLRVHPSSQKHESREGTKLSRRMQKKVQNGDVILEDGRVYDRSLTKALYFTIWRMFTYNNSVNAMAQVLRLTAPLVTKILITQLTTAYNYHQATKSGLDLNDIQRPKSVGYMLGVAFGLWSMLAASSFLMYPTWFGANLMGKKLRSALIVMIARKSMRLSSKSRSVMTNGRLTTMVSVDCSSIDALCHISLDITSAPLFIILGTALLIYTLGYSALVGIGVLALTGPYKTFMFKRISKLRKAQTEIIDTRVRLLSEVLNNIGAVKLYAYEKIWAARIGEMRKEELDKLKSNCVGKSSLTMIVAFIPTLAAIMTYITYSLSGHDLDAAIIFSSLQYFNVMRTPLTMLPRIISGFSEAKVAVRRLSELFEAEELEQDIKIDESSNYGVEAKACFQYERLNTVEEEEGKQQLPPYEKPDDAADAGPNEKSSGATDKIPFSLKDIDLQIPRGSLVCVVGSVATGKTALLSGLLNEMKRTEGEVVFGGSVSYVPQHAWVQSGSVRDNITFSCSPEDVDSTRIEDVVEACALRRDVEMWPQGILTQIGERGITLSGGQRQRICIARAAYAQTPVVLLDDPLSAVDAHVGNHLLQNCILNDPLSSRTRVLVTHHLDILHLADIILVMGRDENGDGRIIQQGSYKQLMATTGTFQTLISQFGSTTHESSSSSISEVEDVEGAIDQTADDADTGAEKTGPTSATKMVEETKLILDEEIAEGSISWTVYRKYGQAINSWILPILVVSFLLLSQAATVFNSLFLGFWSEDKYDSLRQGEYMAIYGALGAMMALFAFGAIYTIFLSGIAASYTMFNQGWNGVIRSPTGWHHRTPTGRIINRLTKDIENLDDRLPDVWYLVANAVLSISGTLALILYVYPWIALLFIPVYIYDFVSFVYYRVTTRDLQRLSSVARSHVYANFGEQLAGLPVIRAFHQQSNYNQRLEKSVDVEMTTVMCGKLIQGSWAGLRINFMSYLLILFVAVFGVIFRNTVAPSQFGVVLTYVIATSSALTGLIGWVAEVEQEMNNVERVQHYGALPTEASPSLPSDPAPSDPWPSHGAISFRDVQLRYRPDLPLVLKGLNFDIHPGEKIGVIGRTGAGKSGIAQALFRTVELSGGKIVIDDRDLQGLGLDTLRQRLSIIPQDTFLFGGTVRENIDPSNTHTDAEMNDALNLIHAGDSSSDLRAKFGLDAMVGNEGSNFSAGERQLLALVRALVRGCRVLLLDEATSSVDPRTDALIQRIIQSQFSNTTIISIAHRLQTVAYYDRILVMDAGKVAEFDSPLDLFDESESIFRALCDKSRITREELLRIRRGAGLDNAGEL